MDDKMRLVNVMLWISYIERQPEEVKIDEQYGLNWEEQRLLPMLENPLRQQEIGVIWCRLKFFEGVNIQTELFCWKNIKKDRLAGNDSKAEKKAQNNRDSTLVFRILF